MAHTFLHHLVIAVRALLSGLFLIGLWTAVALAGLFFWTELPSPFNLVLGAPLFLIGLTMGLSALYEMVVGVVSWRWGRTHCPFCKTSEKPEKILSPHDAFHESAS